MPLRKVMNAFVFSTRRVVNAICKTFSVSVLNSKSCECVTEIRLRNYRETKVNNKKRGDQMKKKELKKIMKKNLKKAFKKQSKEIINYFLNGVDDHFFIAIDRSELFDACLPCDR